MILLGAVMLVIAAAPARSTDERVNTANKQWHGQDNCTRQAFQKFPDYTEEGAAKRDVFVRECLRNNHLLPRNSVAAPPQ